MSNKFVNQGVAIAVGILVVGILVAFTLPIAINGMTDADSNTFNQSVGETVEVTNNLNAALDSSNATTGDITVTLNDTDVNSAKTLTVSQGQNSTVSMPDGDVTVYNQEARANSADIKYEYPKDYGWNNSSSSLYGLLPLFFVLAILLFVVRKATSYT